MKHLNRLLLFLLFISCSSTKAQLAACKGKYFGNITAYSVPSNYTQLWNQTTSENGSKWGSCDRGNGQYNFGNSDLAYNTAKNSKGAFKFHALIWGAQAPSYLANSSAAQIETAIRNWYQAVENHYTPLGGLKMIDVLNEPVNTPINREIANLKAALTRGYQNEPANAGDLNNPYGWAIWPFQLARKHFPDAILLINEFNVEHNWNNCRAEYIKMSNAIKNAPNLTNGQKNCIDGIGLQAHGIETLTASAWRNCINEIWNSTGLPIHITEFDLAADPNEAHQKNKFEEFIPIAWEHPHVAGITLWGFVQGTTWRNGNGQTGTGGTDTGIMYANGNDRPAMAWLRTYLASQASLSCCPAPGPFANCSNAGNPTISITAPTTNSFFTLGTTVTLTATAADADGTISKVEFYNGNTLLGTDNSNPYSFTWSPTTKGTYIITAKATDNAGNIGTSAAVSILVNVPQGPYKGNIHKIPGTIQFEEFDEGGNGSAYMDDTPGSETTVTFRNDEDVDIENCTDTGAGYNIGWTSAGEWLEYTTDVAKAGIYDLELRIACNGNDRTVSISMDNEAIATDIAIPNTTGWQTWGTVTVSGIELLPGQKTMRLTVGATDYVNLNYATFVLKEEYVKEPFNGSAHIIPGRIEAEEYDKGGEGLGYHEENANGNEGGATFRNDEVDIEVTQDGNRGFNIGYALAEEWLAYTVDVAISGKFDLDLRVAVDGEGRTMHIEMDGVNITGFIPVPNTGGWQTWRTVTLKDIELTAGEHDMKVVFDVDYVNLDYVEYRELITAIGDNQFNGFKLYPNPTKEHFTVQCSGNYSYTIVNLIGDKFESGTISETSEIGKDLPKGSYIIQLKSEEGTTINQSLLKY